jgi:hypothetical protein
MVKIPSFDNLKKMGADLIDTAKSVKLGEVVDKFKLGMEAVGAKKEKVSAPSLTTAQILLSGLAASLKELMSMHAVQANAIKKIQQQLAELERVVAASPQPLVIPPLVDAATKYEDKNDKI